MSKLSTTSLSRNIFAEPTATQSSRTLPAAFSLCRDVRLPRGESIAPQVWRIIRHYREVTGLDLDPLEAVWVLDEIRKDRQGIADPYDPRPIPVDLAPICDYMIRETYNDTEIYLTIREIERTGTAELSCGLDGCDREAVEQLIPEGYRKVERERFEAWA
jgi:hypothetical protein